MEGDVSFGCKMINPQEIKNIRKQAGLTQAQLAEYLGLGSQSRISEYERGKRRPSKSVVKLLLMLKKK